MNTPTPAETYWRRVATESIRRLFRHRGEPMARLSLRGWIRTLRQVTNRNR